MAEIRISSHLICVSAFLHRVLHQSKLFSMLDLAEDVCTLCLA